MPIPDKDLAIIDDYLLNNLSEADQQYFEQRLTDPEFSKELAYKKDMFQVLKTSGRKSTKNKLRSIEQSILENEKNQTLSKISRPIIFLIAFILFAALAFFIWKSNQSKATPAPQLFAQFYEPYPNVVSPITMGTTDNNSTQNPFRLYEQGDYESAITGFQKLDTPQTAEINFYLALAQLAQKEYSSIEKLTVISNTANNRYQLAAQWYLALNHLQLENLSLVKSNLKEIINTSNHPFSEKAKALSQALEAK